MGELIENLIRTKVPPPTYCRIQEFLAKVCVVFFSFFSIHSMRYNIYFFIYFSLDFCYRGWSRLYSTKPQTKGLHEHWYALCKRAQEPTGAEELDLILGCSYVEQTVFHILWGFVYLPSQTPTFITTASLSSHTSLIMMSPSQFTTRRTKSRTGLARMTLISSHPLIPWVGKSF